MHEYSGNNKVFFLPQLSSYQIYTIFRKLSRINAISGCYHGVNINASHDNVPGGSKQSPDIPGLERCYKIEADKNQLKLRFLHRTKTSVERADDDSSAGRQPTGDGNSIAVNEMEPPASPMTVQSKRSLESPPNQQSPQHILNALSDDSLRAIFKSAALDLWDLVAIGSVSQRFNAIARDAFASKFDANSGKVFDSIELWRVEECLKTFGALMTTANVLEIDDQANEIVLRLLLEHCGNR